MTTKDQAIEPPYGSKREAAEADNRRHPMNRMTPYERVLCATYAASFVVLYFSLFVWN